jgi:exonuclease III
MEMIRYISIVLFLVLTENVAMAQQTVHIDFDSTSQMYQERVIPEKPGSIFDALPHSFVTGVRGRALDLSKNAALRMPLKLKQELEPDYSGQQSLSVEIWVKTLPGAVQGTPIAGNKKNNSKDNAGWLIYADQDGGWSVSLSDGKNQYNYRPTIERYQINDGKWHQLAFSMDKKKEEVWFYFDGINVAIYNTPGLSDLSSKWETTIGGTASNWDYRGQWEAFNGYIDNFSIWNSTRNANQIKNNYTKHFEMSEKPVFKTEEIKVFSWNIWNGGHRFGKQVGLQRVIETIKASNADVVTLIETYGSGEVIADSLGYHFYLISSNLSVMSRFPIKETIKAFRPFNFGGLVLQIDEEKELVVFDTWLHYLPDYKGNILKGEITAKQLEKDEEGTRLAEIKQILKEIKPWLDNANQTPVVMSGDFNCNSHLDWTEATKDAHLGYVVNWPVTAKMEKAGFIDSFREIHPNPLTAPGYTGWPFTRRTGQRAVENRIDYIFYQGDKLRALNSKVVNYHPVMFPSDHAAVFTTFQYNRK